MNRTDEIAKLCSEYDDVMQKLRSFLTPRPADHLRVLTRQDQDRCYDLFQELAAVLARLREIQLERKEDVQADLPAFHSHPAE